MRTVNAHGDTKKEFNPHSHRLTHSRRSSMLFAHSLSENELYQHIKWLENEIDACLEFDLPTRHLESQLNAIDEILYYREKLNENARLVMH
jgi:hypothetical protein